MNRDPLLLSPTPHHTSSWVHHLAAALLLRVALLCTWCASNSNHFYIRTALAPAPRVTLNASLHTSTLTECHMLWHISNLETVVLLTYSCLALFWLPVTHSHPLPSTHTVWGPAQFHDCMWTWHHTLDTQHALWQCYYSASTISNWIILSINLMLL